MNKVSTRSAQYATEVCFVQLCLLPARLSYQFA